MELVHFPPSPSPSSSSSYPYVPLPPSPTISSASTAAAAVMSGNSSAPGDRGSRGRGLSRSVVSEVAGRLVSGFLTCVFTIVGFFVGAVTGALIGLATESGLFRGAGIGAISGAVFSIDVVESSLVIWRSDGSGIWSFLYVIDIIASLLSGRLVREKVGPAVQNAVQSQMSAVDAPFHDPLDIFETGGTHGMSRTSVDRIPKLRVTAESAVDSSGEKICCSVCLQIYKILKNNSIRGLSVAAFELEVVGFTIALSYCLHNGLPFSAYGELLFLLIQAIILVAIIYYYSQPVGSKTWIKALLYCAIAPTILAGQIDPVLFEALYASQHAIFFCARVPQIWKNYKNKSTGELSFLTFLMNFGGSSVRVFTSMQEKAPTSVILGSVLGILTNGTILSQILIYQKPPMGKQKKVQ